MRAAGEEQQPPLLGGGGSGTSFAFAVATSPSPSWGWAWKRTWILAAAGGLLASWLLVSAIVQWRAGTPGTSASSELSARAACSSPEFYGVSASACSFIGNYSEVRASPLLPSLFIIGAAKAGTTSVYAWAEKAMGNSDYCTVTDPGPHGGHEVNVWAAAAEPTADDAWLRSFSKEADFAFGRPARAGRCHPGAIGVDKSPAYLAVPAVPWLMSCVLGERVLARNKMVAVLREPVLRLASHFSHFCGERSGACGNRSATLEAWAIDAVDRHRAKCPDLWRLSQHRTSSAVARLAAARHAWLACRRYITWSTVWLSYPLSIGLYAVQLDHWLQFVSRSQLLVLRFDELLSQPAAVFSRIASFSLPHGRAALSGRELQLPHANSHAHATGAATPMGCPLRDALEAFHRDFDELLPQVVNRHGGPPEQHKWPSSRVDWGERAPCRAIQRM